MPLCASVYTDRSASAALLCLHNFLPHYRFNTAVYNNRRTVPVLFLNNDILGSIRLYFSAKVLDTHTDVRGQSYLSSCVPRISTPTIDLPCLVIHSLLVTSIGVVSGTQNRPDQAHALFSTLICGSGTRQVCPSSLFSRTIFLGI
jgi:hypothetical protein